jgi:hypothetical protein
MKIRFSKRNKNVLYVDDGIIILPPSNNGCDIIPLGKLETSYKFDFKGLVVLTEDGNRRVFYEGRLVANN